MQEIKKAYVIEFSEVNNHINTEEIQTLIESIIDINPDKIILLCLGEYDYQYIFDNFFRLITPYLEQNNKILHLVGPFQIKDFYNSRICIEESYAHYKMLKSMIIDCISKNATFTFTDETKLYTNYNNNNKYPRAMLIDSLTKFSLLDDGIVTLHNPLMYLPNGEIYQYKYYNGAKLLDEADFILNSQPHFSPVALPKSYLHGFIDIVSESTYDDGQFFVTEKTTKPIAVCKPFLVLGPKHIHKFLKNKYDIEYYDEIFDYSFDNESNIEHRIQGIIDNLLRLKNLTKEKLKELHYKVKEKMLQNRYNFIQIDQDQSRYVPPVIAELLHGDYALFGKHSHLLKAL